MDYTFFNEDNTYTGIRIDVFLSENIENASRSAAQKLIESGQALVNGKSVNKNYKIRENDEITVFYQPPQELDVLPQKIKLDILYEDSELIVINKPKGMVVHPANGHYDHTLVNGLLYHCKGSLSGINGVMRPGIVHRIDKDTSGVLVVAKTDNAHQKLSEQFSDHSIKRAYLAVVNGNIKEDKITVNKPISRHTADRLKMAVNENGKRAVTHINVIKRFGAYTLIEARLETGRTHQIRVHMAHIKHPLLGDSVYGHKNNKFTNLGQILHAKKLGFIHPLTNQYMEFVSSLPDYFEKVINWCELQ